MLKHILSAGSIPHSRRFTLCAVAFALSTTLASAIPLRPADEKENGRDGDREESPAEPLWENFPASENLLPAPVAKSVKIPLQRARGDNATIGWTFRGPSPIPNGQTVGGTFGNPATQLSVNGRVASIAINPTNPDIAYVGAASGGLYRTTDGGASWVQLMDVASAPAAGVTLSIGSVAIDPTNTSRVFVGTGEGNLSGDSFFGTGFYIITGADTATPTVSGPFNAASGFDPLGGVPAGADIFTGRSIVAIAVDPTNSNNVYVSTSSGTSGKRAASYSVLPRRGIYRTQNALSGSPTWTRLQIGGTSNNTISSSCLLDPQNPTSLIVSMVGQAAADPSGVYRTTNATAATPTFTQSLALPASTSLFANSKLSAGFSASVNGGTTVVYATSAENAPNASNQGKLYKSIDAGATFTNIPAVNGFAGGQGFYDISVGTAPTNPNIVAVGGQADFKVFERSTDGGATWTIDPSGGPYTISTGLHADVHAIVWSASNPNVVYHGNDGGIFRSTNAGNTWNSLNGGGFSAVQFSHIALHPTDADFTDSGSQDNGTEQLRPGGTVFRIDFGDGGYTAIDQNAPDTTNVVQYHTYFNQTNNLIGAARVLSNPCAVENQWSVRGIYGGSVDPTVHCDGTTDKFNGIILTDNTDFYAPMTLGPGTPNTWYFGTDKLYRSPDQGDTATAQTAFLGDFVNDIAISWQDDNVRILGTNGSDGTGAGSVWATTTGGAMVKIAGSGATNGPGVLIGSAAAPAPVGAVAIDPNNKNIAYVGFTGYGNPAAPYKHMYRVNNLDQLGSGGAVSITAISNGLPDVPIDSIAIDPQSGGIGRASTDIYVGTDIGVYRSTNGGASWAAFNTNLPRVPVFGLAIQNPNRILRAATHGRGWYDNSITASPAAAPSLLSLSSRKVHGTAGTYDVDLPLTGGGVEPRRGSVTTGAPGSFTIIARFTNTLAATQSGATITFTPGSGGTAPGGGAVGAGTGNVNSVTASGTDLTIQLTNVSDIQTATLSISGVTDSNGMTLASPVTIPISFCTGDTTGDKTVNVGDIAQVKTSSGSTTSAANFRRDLNVDGTINVGDITIVKTRSGATTP